VYDKSRKNAVSGVPSFVNAATPELLALQNHLNAM